MSLNLYRKRYEVDAMYVFRIEHDNQDTIEKAMIIAHSVIDAVANETDKVPELTISPNSMKDENGQFFFILTCNADWIEVAFKIRDEIDSYSRSRTLQAYMFKKIKFMKDRLIYSVSLGKKSSKLFTHLFDETGFEYHGESEVVYFEG